MRRNDGGERWLQGLRVLIAEDSFPVAFAIETVLAARGAEIIGPASTLEAASSLARSEAPDLAVVDLNLGHESALPLVRELVQAGRRVIVATGYDLTSETRAAIAGSPVLKKPYTPDQLVSLIRGLL